MTAWELLKANRCEEAIPLFTAELAERPSTGVHNNRGTAYLLLGDFARALADFEAAERVSEQTSGSPGDGAKCGVAHWMAGEYQQAATVWERGAQAMLEGRIVHTDAAGGVSIANLLWFAATRLQDAARRALATKVLRKRLRTKQSQAWPGPVSRFLLGQIGEAEMRAAITSTPILRERELCTAEFFVGVAALESNVPFYHESMQRAVEMGSVSKIEVEYYLALHEVGRGKRTDAASPA
ncbi:MAG: tetratricopeptide repeat protein [Chthoniobacter sp.]|nr:tetratricopeptide repeat protein [Chthoniobacter sp.]